MKKLFKDIKIGESFSYELFPNQYVAAYKVSSRTADMQLGVKVWQRTYIGYREELNTGAVVFDSEEL